MKIRSLSTALLAASLATAQAELPILNLAIDGSEAILSWEATPLNPSSSSQLFYGFQLEASADMQTWTPVGASIPSRVGGVATSHSERVALSDQHYFRLALSLDLAGQDLRGSDFSGVDFSGADLSGADLSDADLAGANLLEANMEGTTLSSFGGPAGRDIHASIPNLPYRIHTDGFQAAGGNPDAGLVSTDTILLMPSASATTAEINALLATHGGAVVGGFGGDSEIGQRGLLIIRFAPGAAATIAETLDGEPVVEAAVEDRYLYPDALPDLNGALPFWDEWDSISTDSDGSWGIRNCRIPQLWNFNEALIKRGRSVEIGMVDSGYYPEHDELLGTFVPLDSSSSPPREAPIDRDPNEHGTAVCSVMAGSWEFGEINGINPFATVYGVGREVAGSTVPGTGAMAVGKFFSDLVQKLLIRPDLTVINISMGYEHKTNPSLSRPSSVIRNSMIFRNIIVTRNAPIIVSSAGNDGWPAQWNSSANYAAIETGQPHIFVVEALQGDATGNESLVTDWDGPSGPQTWGSNFAGNLSAPGFGIAAASNALQADESSSIQSFHRLFNGTSFAAPIVSGIISYLYALEPSLTKDEVVMLINSTAKPIPGAAPKIDAFAAALKIDTLRQGYPVLKTLLDINDASLDGNQRVVMLAKTDESADPKDFDKSPYTVRDYAKLGDDRIDMRDFRRFRDWNLIVRVKEREESADDGLNGLVNNPTPNIPAIDPNRNGHPCGSDKFDLYYPRHDFNGDGLRYIPGDKAPLPPPLSSSLDRPSWQEFDDLEVFQELFYDPLTGYDEDELPGLIQSSDLNISLYWFIEWNVANREADSQIDQVTVRVESRGSREVREFTVPIPLDIPRRQTHFIITLKAPEQHRVYVCGDTRDGTRKGLGENTLFAFDSTPGRDYWFAPRVRPDETPCRNDDGGEEEGE